MLISYWCILLRDSGAQEYDIDLCHAYIYAHIGVVWAQIHLDGGSAFSMLYMSEKSRIFAQ